jgi:putative addiction module killer protein
MLKFKIREYLSENGQSPFDKWLMGLGDIRARARVDTRLNRASLGNLGDYASVGGGVFELRIFYGPGYRVYYSLESDNVVLFLLGGTKGTQKRDFQIARAYLEDYRNRENGHQ